MEPALKESSATSTNENNSKKPTSKSRIPVMKNSTLLEPAHRRGPRKTIIVADPEEIFSPPPQAIPRPIRRRGSPIARVTRQCSIVQDTTIPAIVAIRNYTRKPSNLSTSISAADIVDKNKEDESNNLGGTHVADQVTSENVLTPFGEKAEIPYNHNLTIAFDIYETTPLTYKSNRKLSMPADADEWSVAVLQQRWYQSIGSKLCVDAEEFQNEALHGLEYLEAWHRSVDPQNQILHRWAMDIIEEIKFHVSEPEKAACHNYEDGSWKHPSAIVPELVELLPLPLDKRIKYYGQVFVMFDEVARQFNPVLKPCKTHAILGHRCVSQSCEKDLLKSGYLSKVLAGFAGFCWEIAEDVKSYFHDVYSRRELNAIEEAWWDELESDRIEAEREEAERSVSLRMMQEGKERRNTDFGFFTGNESLGSASGNSLSLASKQKRKEFEDEAVQDVVENWDNDQSDEDQSQEAKSAIKPFPLQPQTRSDIQKQRTRPQFPLASRDVLKPDVFNWADEDEDEVPDAFQWSAAVPQNFASDGGLELKSSSESVTHSFANQQGNITNMNRSEQLLEVTHESHTAAIDSHLSKSTTASPVSLSQDDLNIFEDMTNGSNTCLIKNVPEHSTKDGRHTMGNDGVESKLLISVEEEESSEVRQATLLNEEFQQPKQKDQRERSGDALEYESELGGLIVALVGRVFDDAKSFAVSGARAWGEWVMAHAG